MENKQIERNILAEAFGSQKRWVNWENVTKRPLQPSGKGASIDDPSTFSTYEAVSYTHLTLPTKRIV